MAARNKHDIQVDPFNAGEPILPWDEPSTYVGGEGDDCAFGDAPYQSPTKSRDNYDAPSSHDPSARAQFEDAQDRREARRAAKAAAKTAKRQARAELKRATGSKPFRIFKTIFIIVLLVNLLPVIFGLFGLIFDDVLPEIFDDGSSVEETHLPRPVADDVQERECIDTVAARLDQIANGEDETIRATIVAQLEGGFSDALGYSAAELGIDPNEYADWLFASFSYEITSVYVYEDGSASLFFDSWSASSYAVEDDMTTAIYDYLDAEGLLRDSSRPPLTEEQRSAVHALFVESLAGADSDDYFCANVLLDDIVDVWTIDEEEFESQAEMALGLF